MYSTLQGSCGSSGGTDTTWDQVFLSKTFPVNCKTPTNLSYQHKGKMPPKRYRKTNLYCALKLISFWLLTVLTLSSTLIHCPFTFDPKWRQCDSDSRLRQWWSCGGWGTLWSAVCQPPPAPSLGRTYRSGSAWRPRQHPRGTALWSFAAAELTPGCRTSEEWKNRN